MTTEFKIVCRDEAGAVVDEFAVNPVTPNARLALERAADKLRLRDSGHGDKVVSITVEREAA